MKVAYNVSAHKTINVEHDGEVYNIEPFKRLEIPDDVAKAIADAGWENAQITEVSSEPEPWEFKVLPSLPPEMQAKVKFQTPKKLVGPSEPTVVEPKKTASGVGGADSKHFCPRGCGYSSPSLVSTRKHMAKCAPIPAEAE